MHLSRAAAHASHWLDEDHTPEVAQVHRLGHAIPSIRGTYAHVTPTMTARLLEDLQARWLHNGDYW